MEIALHEGAQAERLLGDPEFSRQWQELYERCSWATAFQSVGFVSAWYRTYRQFHAPLLVTGFQEGEGLAGLLPLALSTQPEAPVGAGTHHAEYQGWLAASPQGDFFVEAAFDALSQRFPGGTLELKYLPPTIPLDAIRLPSKWAGSCELEPGVRHVLAIGDGSRFRESLKRKGDRNRLNRLARLGTLRLSRITDPAEMELIFDDFTVFYDFRMGAMYDVLPFERDPLKRGFQLAQMRVPGLAHVTALWAGETLLSVHMGTIHRSGVCSGPLGHSPLHASCSPGRLHLLLLGEQLAKENVASLDLTPGGDPWKQKSATHQDEVFTLRVSFSRSLAIRRRMGRRALSLARAALASVGVRPALVRTAVQELGRIGVRRTVGAAARAVRRWVVETQELRFYRAPDSPTGNAQKTESLAKDRLADLLAFRPPAESSLTRQSFLRAGLFYLEEGSHFYSYAEDSGLRFCAWVVVGKEIRTLFKGTCTISLPSPAAIVFGVYALSRQYLEKCLPNLLNAVWHGVRQQPGLDCIYVCALPEEARTAQLLEHLGFTSPGSCFRRSAFGKPSFESTLAGVKIEARKPSGASV